jgi:hypothetical protein
MSGTLNGWSIKLNTDTDRQRAAQARVRGLIWDFYASLKAYRATPRSYNRDASRARFDRIFLHRTGFATLNRQLTRLYANKAAPGSMRNLSKTEIWRLATQGAHARSVPSADLGEI